MEKKVRLGLEFNFKYLLQEHDSSSSAIHRDINVGYFIFSLKDKGKDSKMKFVNISSSQQRVINLIIKRHCRVTKEGWDHGKNMTYFFKVDRLYKFQLIKLVTALLLSLYSEGWEPMTPVDTAVDKADKQTSICWRRRDDVTVSSFRGSALSLDSVRGKVVGLITLKIFTSSRQLVPQK